MLNLGSFFFFCTVAPIDLGGASRVQNKRRGSQLLALPVLWNAFCSSAFVCLCLFWFHCSPTVWCGAKVVLSCVSGKCVVCVHTGAWMPA